MAKWKEGINPRLIINRINNSRKINAKGELTTSGFEFHQYVGILQGLISFDEKIPQITQSKFVREVFFDKTKKVLTGEYLLKEICKKENLYNSKKLKKYKIVTSISMSSTLRLRPFFIDKCKISFLWDLKGNFRKEREALINERGYFLTDDIPDRHYKFVVINVEAKSEDEAMNKGLDALDYSRAIWNFGLNRSMGFRISSRSNIPVNSILLGPFHTLHNLKGNLATQVFWYQPEYRKRERIYSDKSQIEDLYSFQKKLRASLATISYREELKLALIKYGRALDMPDHEASFLKLWAILESLTGTMREGYKITIRRTAFIFREPDYHLEVLKMLMEFRNQVVHVGTEDRNAEVYLFQLKGYVETILGFHIWKLVRFESLSEATEFLDMSRNMKNIDSKIKLLNKARKFLKS